jgi:hypothetical protein
MTAAFLKPYNVPDIDNPGHYHPDNKLVKPYYNQSMVTLVSFIVRFPSLLNPAQILETAHKYNLGAQIHTIGESFRNGLNAANNVKAMPRSRQHSTALPTCLTRSTRKVLPLLTPNVRSI